MSPIMTLLGFAFLAWSSMTPGIDPSLIAGLALVAAGAIVKD